MCIREKKKAQISCAVNVQLISTFVFATQIVLSLTFLNPKSQASSLLLYITVCDGPGPNPKLLVFLSEGSLCFSTDSTSKSTNFQRNTNKYQEPVVQSIVSLMISLRHKFVKQISAEVTNTVIFC